MRLPTIAEVLHNLARIGVFQFTLDFGQDDPDLLLALLVRRRVPHIASDIRYFLTALSFAFHVLLTSVCLHLLECLDVFVLIVAPEEHFLLVIVKPLVPRPALFGNTFLHDGISLHLVNYSIHSFSLRLLLGKRDLFKLLLGSWQNSVGCLANPSFDYRSRC